MPTRFLLGGGPVSPPSIGPLTANPFPTASPPYVGLEIADTVSLFSTIRVERHDPDGVWRPVRSANPAQLGSGSSWAGGDYEAPYGVALQYRAVREDGSIIPSLTDVGFGPGPDVLLDSPQVWLVHPGQPSLSTQVMVQAFSDVSLPARRGVFQPLTATRPIIVTSSRLDASSQVTLLTSTATEESRLRVLLSDGQTLLLNVPPAKRFGLDTVWIAVGDVTESRVVRIGSDPYRSWALPYTVVDSPVGGVINLWNYAALSAEQPSYRVLSTSYATYADLAAHRPL